MPKTLSTFSFLPILGLLAVGPAAVPAQSGSFDITESGTHVGTATFNFRSTPKGYDSTSVVRVSTEGLDYQLSKTEELDAANHFVHVILSGVVNGSAVNIIGAPDAGQVLLIISANGRTSTTRLDAHPGAVVVPDFDAGALETLLALAVEQNNRDLWAIIPRGAGTVTPVRLATYADQQGTLDGKPITVHHLIATIADISTDLFSGPENQLLQAELPQEGFALVRKGFVLTPPARPGAPPPDAPTNPQQQPQTGPQR
jgi:hypothetical protein